MCIDTSFMFSKSGVKVNHCGVVRVRVRVRVDVRVRVRVRVRAS